MKLSTSTFSIISLLLIAIGFLLGYKASFGFEREHIEIVFNEFNKFTFEIGLFILIFLKNSIVALLLSVGGYFTAGILTALVLLWNGINLGSLFTIYHYTNLNLYEFISLFIIHGTFEFISFILFANIGFSGIIFYNKMLKSNEIQINFNIKQFVIPICLLFFAAFIEIILISNF